MKTNSRFAVQIPVTVFLTKIRQEWYITPKKMYLIAYHLLCLGLYEKSIHGSAEKQFAVQEGVKHICILKEHVSQCVLEEHDFGQNLNSSIVVLKRFIWEFEIGIRKCSNFESGQFQSTSAEFLDWPRSARRSLTLRSYRFSWKLNQPTSFHIGCISCSSWGSLFKC